MKGKDPECPCYNIQDVPNKCRGLFASRDLSSGINIHTTHCKLISQQEYGSRMKCTGSEHYLFNCQDVNRA